MAEINGDLRFIGGNSYRGTYRFTGLDFNTNGVLDLVVGARGGVSEIVIYFDRQIQPPNQRFDLLFEEPDVIIKGSMPNYPGDTLTRIDLNNDGYMDLITSESNSDMVYCLFASPEWETGTVVTLPDEPADLTISNLDAGPNNEFGYDVASGDVNGDGISDLIIGEFLGPNYSGQRPGGVHVIYGRESFQPPEWIEIVQTPADITIFGVETGDQLGLSVSCGDVNGDGFDDIVAGANWAGQDVCGRVYVIYGSDAFPSTHLVDLQQEQADIEIKGPHAWSRTGWAVTVSDLNGDGKGDICFSSVWEDTVPEYRGVVHAVYGRSNFPAHHLIDLASEPTDLSIVGEVEDAYLGNMLTGGDLDGDGCEELAISAYNCRERRQDHGASYVIAGLKQYPKAHIIDLTVDHATIKMLGRSPEGFMIWLSEMIDVDADGRRDLIFSASRTDRETFPLTEDAGEIYVLLSDGTLYDPPRYLASPGFHPDNPAELRLFDPFDHDEWMAQYSPYLVEGYGLVSAAGDLDGDGYQELITGPGPGPAHPALVHLLDNEGERLASFQAYGTPRYGVLVTSGDLDGDGVDEILTGAGPGPVYGPHVRGWRWDGAETVTPIPGVSILAYGTNRWGVNVTCGDIDGDGNDEIVTGAGPGDVFGPHVRGWDVDGGTAEPLSAVSYFAYGTLRWGVNVACGDIDGDGIDEIVTGPGPSEQFSSHVRGWNYDGDTIESMTDVNFIAYASFPKSMGCLVACGDADNDRVDEILTAPGPHPDNPAYIKTWNYDDNVLSLVQGKSFLVFETGEYHAGARIALGRPYQPPSYLP